VQRRATRLPGSNRALSSSHLQTWYTPLAGTIWRSLFADRSADGAVGIITVDTTPVLGMELCLAGLGGRIGSLGEMLELRHESGNAGWLSWRCLHCIAAAAHTLPETNLPLAVGRRSAPGRQPCRQAASSRSADKSGAERIPRSLLGGSALARDDVGGSSRSAGLQAAKIHAVIGFGKAAGVAPPVRARMRHVRNPSRSQCAH